MDKECRFSGGFVFVGALMMELFNRQQLELEEEKGNREKKEKKRGN